MKGTINMNNERGAILVLTMVMLVLCSGILSALIITSQSDNRGAIAKSSQVFAMTSTESGVAYAGKMTQNALANYSDPPASGTVVVNDANINFTIQKTLNSSGQEIGVSTITHDGLNTLSKLYTITAVGVYKGVYSSSRAFVSLDSIPIFQFLAFYDSDLEIFPGPAMNLNGRIHTNKNLFMGSDNALKLLTGQIRTSGNFYRYRKDSPNTRPPNLWVRDKNGTLVNIPTNEDSNWKGTYNGASTDWATMVLDKYAGNIMSGAHGVSKIESPAIGAIKPYVANPNGTGDYKLVNGNWVSSPGTGTHDKGFYNQYAGLVVAGSTIYVGGQQVTPDANVFTNKTMYDAREGKTVTVTEVNMGLLKTAKGTLSNGTKVDLWPSNGLVYAYRNDSTTTQPNGIRLTNGAELKTKLTVVSPNPVYIKGDYNTTNKKGASVLSDAVNLLSNAWNDSKTSSSGLPAPTNTTYNVAMITGNYSSAVGNYNGGFENFPRFHENWSGKTARIRGSFVNVWESEIAKGKWVYGSPRYTAPNRDWDFDTDFLDMNNLPPFTPQVYSLRTIAWWRTGRLPYSIFVTK